MFSSAQVGRSRARISLVDRLEYFLRSRASKVVVLALVANTMVAQLLYNSAGQLVLGNGVLLGYLLISAVCSTLAFALFEVSTIFRLHDLMALDSSIKSEIGADKLIKRGYVVLAVSSVINFLSVLYFLALAWHTAAGEKTREEAAAAASPLSRSAVHSAGRHLPDQRSERPIVTVTVALAAMAPETRGRRWTAVDYAQRDAVLGALGIKPFRQPPSAH